MILGIDIETYSEADIGDGAWAYSVHPSTGVWCVSLGWSTGRGHLELHTWKPGGQLPFCWQHRLGELYQKCAHNAAFEISILQNILMPKHRWQDIPVEEWVDTAQLASAANLPTSLEGLALALGTAAKKDMDGSKLMKRLARAGAQPTPGELDALCRYCEQDVRTMIECYWRLPSAGGREEAVRIIDRKINFRGVRLDVSFAERLALLAEERGEVLSGFAFELTSAELENSTSTPALKRWLGEKGIALPTKVRTRKNGETHKSTTVDRQTVHSLLQSLELDPVVRAVLEVRVEAGRLTSLAKLRRVPNIVGADQRLRWSLEYCGAHTGRWAGRGLQLHNMRRLDKTLKDSTGDMIQAVRALDLDALSGFGQPLDVMSQLLRSIVVASPGHDLLGADYSAIEARVLAWVAGEQSVLDAFLAGRDIYVEDAKAIGSTDRQLGKVCRLALGYGMGAIKFATTAAQAPYNVPLSLKEARRIQQAWRKSNPAIVRLWGRIEQAAIFVVRSIGEVEHVGPLRLHASDRCLVIQLPSGRMLRYWRPFIKQVWKQILTVDDEGNQVEKEFEVEELRFFEPASDRRGMAVQSTYGGKLTENVVQAISRDVLAEALLRLEDAGFPVVVHVHDSIVAEVPENERRDDWFRELLLAEPHWGEGLPLSADVYRSKRFKG